MTEGTSLDEAQLVKDFGGHVLPTARLVALFHGMQLRRFGGAAGLRDSGLLESAVARGAQVLAYSSADDIIEAACAIGEGIIRNHPFVDGNKRTAFATIVSTLAVNDCRLEMEPGRRGAGHGRLRRQTFDIRGISDPFAGACSTRSSQ